MARNNSDEKVRAYIIPYNFIEGGRILNGMFKFRNAIEAVLIGGIVLALALLVPIKGVEARISFVVSVVSPWLLICITGINDDSFLTFIKNAVNWNKYKKVMLYDDTPHPREAAPLDMMMAEMPMRDKIITKFEEFNEKRKNSIRERMSKATFELEDDEELKRLKTPKQRRAEKLESVAMNTSAKSKALVSEDAEDVDGMIEEPTPAADDYAISFDSVINFDDKDLYS